MSKNNVVSFPTQRIQTPLEVDYSITVARLLDALTPYGMTLRHNPLTGRLRIIDIPPAIAVTHGREQ